MNFTHLHNKPKTPLFSNKRAVFFAEQQAIDLKMSDEQIKAKEQQALKSPDSFKPDQDFQQSKIKLDATASKNGIDKTDPKYTEALAQLEKNKGFYEAAISYSKEKLASWPKLMKFGGAIAPRPDFANYQLAVEATQLLSSLDAAHQKIYGKDQGYIDKYNPIKNNIELVVTSYIDSITAELKNEKGKTAAEEVAEAQEFNGDLAEKAKSLSVIQGQLGYLMANKFAPLKDNIDQYEAKAKAKYDHIQSALDHFAQINLDQAKEANKSGKYSAEDKIKNKDWLKSAEEFKQLQEIKKGALAEKITVEKWSSSNKAHVAIDPKDPLLIKANQLLETALKLDGNNYRKATEAFQEAKVAYLELEVQQAKIQELKRLEMIQQAVDQGKAFLAQNTGNKPKAQT